MITASCQENQILFISLFYVLCFLIRRTRERTIVRVRVKSIGVVNQRVIYKKMIIFIF